MINFDTAAHEYFSPPLVSFWQWQEQGEVLCWRDGATIAFRQELVEVLERLAPYGLPGLDDVLLVLAACRQSWNEPPARRGILAGYFSRGNREAEELKLRRQASFAGTADDLFLLNRVCERLDDIHRVAVAKCGAASAKAELCAMVFENAELRHSPELSKRLAQALANGWNDDGPVMAELVEAPAASRVERHAAQNAEPTSSVRGAHVAQMRRTLSTLDMGFERGPFDAVLERLRTGLEYDIRPAQIESPPPGAARQLIDALGDDEELAGLARLARHILMLVQFPRPVGQPHDLPQGGVSDISNRGSLDRLLVSELAHDNLTLAIRVATGEALYLHRESPPAMPTRRRVILLDSGIRLWGAPRVYAAAVALAMAAGETARQTVEIWRAEGKRVKPVELRTRQGLLDLMAVLDSRAHPGAALPAWLAEAEGRAADKQNDDELDAVLITGEDVWADAEFRLAVDALPLPSIYVATVNRSGAYRLFQHSPQGAKPLRAAQLALDEILDGKEDKNRLPYRAEDDLPLPAFLLHRTRPLLQSHVATCERAWSVRGHGVFSLSKLGHLLHWTAPHRGAREIGSWPELERGRVLWAATEAQGDLVRAIVGKLSRRGMYYLEINLRSLSATLQRMPLDSEQPLGAFERNGFLFVEYGGRVNVFDASGAHLLCAKDVCMFRTQRQYGTYLPAVVWNGAGYNGVGHVAFNGFDLEHHAFPAHFPPHYDLLAAFPAQGIEGLVAISTAGEIIFSDGSRKKIVRNSHGRLELFAVSRDGLRFVIADDPDDSPHPQFHRKLVYTLNGASRPTGYAHFAVAESPQREFMRPKQLRMKFQSIGIDDRGRLVLVSHRGSVWPFYFDAQQKRYFMATKAERNPASMEFVRFEDHEPWMRDGHLGLSVARWPDGSRAVLDARGLLHFCSSRANLPEFTLVLIEGASSGWSADGRHWGDAYFIDDATAAAHDVVYREIIEPFIRDVQ